MSYLMEELTDWWPLLSFGLDCYLTEGNEQRRAATRDPVTSRRHINAKLFDILHLFSTVYVTVP